MIRCPTCGEGHPVWMPHTVLPPGTIVGAVRYVGAITCPRDDRTLYVYERVAIAAPAAVA